MAGYNGMAGNGLKWLDMAKNGWNGWQQLEFAGNGQKWLEIDRNGVKLRGMAGNGWK